MIENHANTFKIGNFLTLWYLTFLQDQSFKMKGNKFVEILVLFLFFVCSVRAIDLDIENLAEKTSSPTTLSRRMDIILMPQDRSAPTNSHPPYLSPNIRRYDGPANGPPWENGFPFAPPPARLPPLRPPPSRSFESGVEEVAMHLEHLMSEISVFNNISGRYDAVMAQMRNMETELTNLNNDLSRMRRDMDDEFARRPPPPRGFPPIRGGNINYFNPPALPSRRRGRVLEEPKGFPEISCPSNYVRIKWRCYFFSLFVSQDWDTASDYCVRDKQTGHLAQFETIEEYQDMIKYISDHQELADESYWIGGNYKEPIVWFSHRILKRDGTATVRRHILTYFIFTKEFSYRRSKILSNDIG